MADYSVYDDIQRAHSKMKRAAGQSYENFAEQLYNVHVEIMSTHAGRDLRIPFRMLGSKNQEHWIESAKKHKTEK